MIHDRGPYRRNVLKSYMARQSKEDLHPQVDKFVKAILEDQGFRAEDDPRSIYHPSQLYDVLERYGTDWSQYERWDSHLAKGFRVAYKILAKPESEDFLEPLRSVEQLANAVHMEKSSGLPAMTSKLVDFPYALDRERQVRLGTKHPNPCVAYARTQQGNKTRLVWGYPLEMTLMEARFARPLIDKFKIARTTMTFGKSKAAVGSYVYDYIIDRPGTIVSLDYSKFDSTIPATLIDKAFSILATWFKDSDRAELGWDTIEKYFITTPIVMPDGHLYTGKTHGVPSGSYFTQMVDSVVNTIVDFAVASYLGVNLYWRSLYVLGDDALLNIQGSFDIENWAQYLKSIGMIVNTKKTVIGRAHFIGAFWDNGMPDVPLQQLINKAVQPERWRNYQGNPDRGSASVVASYAGNYLCAYQMMRSKYITDMAKIDSSESVYGISPNLMSGSDRLLAMELARSGEDLSGGRSGVPSPLSVRILL